jgi:hypothetical protein
METKVIEMPKSKMKNFQKRMSDHFHERKGSVAVSMASILVISLFANQWLSSPTSMLGLSQAERTGGHRGIASVRTEDYASRVRWEHEMAEQIATGNYQNAHFAMKPSERDELLFGMLAGRYGAEMAQGHVMGLHYTETSGNGEPVAIENGQEFLMKYKDVWSAQFAKVELENKTGNTEVYNLKGEQGETAAKAQLDFDQAGRLTAVKILK